MTQSLQSQWDDVVAAAILGTERRPFVPPGAAMDRLGQLLSRLNGEEPGRALLATAAALALYCRAGRMAVTDEAPAPEPCGAEERPACSRVSAGHLKRMLAGEHAAALEEWLTRLASSGRRVADDCLVALLERGRRERELLPLIKPVLGRRGEWLAAQNSDWAFIFGFTTQGVANEADWETGTRAERIALLEQVRSADPGRGRALVESTWTQDPAEDRTAFLETFSRGLSMADEPFLEAALDDRRKDVRRAAAGLLARLAESRLVGRMKARVVPILKLTAGRTPEIEAVLPEACDKAMIRDGIEPKPPAGPSAVGEKAWWLQQMVAAVPPATWCQTFAHEPHTLVAIADRSPWHLALRRGWTLAAYRYREPSWAEALVLAPVREDEPIGTHGLDREVIRELLALVPGERIEAHVLACLRGQQRSPANEAAAIPLLFLTQHEWSPDFARVILDRLRTNIASNGGSARTWHLLPPIDRLARSIPVSLAFEAAERWPTESAGWAFWSKPIHTLVSLLQFRHEILTELQS